MVRPVLSCQKCTKPRWGRYLLCERHQKAVFSGAMVRTWKRRKAHAAHFAAPLPSVTKVTDDDLTRLFADLEHTEAKALAAADRYKARY